MRNGNDLSFYRQMMRNEVTVDRNKTAPRCRNCAYYHPEFRYRRCLYAVCPYGKADADVFRKRPLGSDKFSRREVVR